MIRQLCSGLFGTLAIFFAMISTSASTLAQGTLTYQALKIPESGTNIISPHGLAYNNVLVGSAVAYRGGPPTALLRFPAHGAPSPSGPSYMYYTYPDNSANPTVFSAINRNGVIVGNAGSSGNPRGVSFIYNNGTYTPYQISNFDTALSGINTQGELVGNIGNGTSGFLQDTNKIISFYTMPNSNVIFPAGINDNGWIVGGYLASTKAIDAVNYYVQAYHAFAIVNGGMYNIDPGGFGSNTFIATGINNNGQVSIITADPASAHPQANTYQVSSYLLDLNTLFRGDPSYYNQVLLNFSSYSINVSTLNDDGYIAGTYDLQPDQLYQGFMAGPQGAMPQAIKGRAIGSAKDSLSIDGLKLGPGHPRYLGEAKFIRAGVTANQRPRLSPSR